MVEKKNIHEIYLVKFIAKLKIRIIFKSLKKFIAICIDDMTWGMLKTTYNNIILTIVLITINKNN